MILRKLSQIKEEATAHGNIEKLSKKVLLRQGQIPHLTQFAQGYFKPGAFASKHLHKDMYEIFLVEKGKVEFTVNNKTFILHQGDCLTIEPYDTHEVKNNSKKLAVLTYFSIKYTQE